MISGAISIAVGLFKIPLTVTDYTYSTNTDREDVKTLYRTRTIHGAVDPTRSKAMERIFGGSIGDGDISIITDDTLYIDDEYSTETRYQSFISFSGKTYRVSDTGDWSTVAGVKVYLCKRYKAQ